MGIWTALGIQGTDEGEDLQVMAAAVWEEVLEEAGHERFPWEKLGEGLLVRSKKLCGTVKGQVVGSSRPEFYAHSAT